MVDYQYWFPLVGTFSGVVAMLGTFAGPLLDGGRPGDQGEGLLGGDGGQD